MRFILTTVIIGSLSIVFYTCRESDLTKGERLAKNHCSSCHLFPDPSLLDKKTWKDGVMPEMAFRMGLDISKMFVMPDADREAAKRSLPRNTTLSEGEFDLIKLYYQSSAPDSLVLPEVLTDPIKQFQVTVVDATEKLQPNISMIEADTITNSIWISDRTSNLFQLDFDFNIKAAHRVNSPASSMVFKKASSPLVLVMGNMDPNDSYNGELIQLQGPSLLDSLNRPVSFEAVDLNNDKLDDYVICSFGHYTGSIQVFQNLGNNTWKSHPLFNLPGARKLIIKDFDGNGWLDIIALITQGDEQIQLFLNSGGFRFRLVTVLRFPPLYGSSYFEIKDMNADGKPDIIYANGDNADYSQTLKPYHGLRIFLNKGGYEFGEAWFFAMPGASKTAVEDFDSDGDMDIAAISFFPDFKKPLSSFLYLENQGKGLFFKPYSSPLAASARWLCMESLDLDQDKDIDLVVSALNFYEGVARPVVEKWKEEKKVLMVLRNNGAPKID